MRIRVIQAPTGEIDGISLDRFVRGNVYDVGTSLGCYLLASQLAEPVMDERPALVTPLDELPESSIPCVRNVANERPLFRIVKPRRLLRRRSSK